MAIKKSFLSNATGVFITQVTVYAIGMIAGIVLNRNLGPGGRGLIAALMVYPLAIFSIAEMGIRQAAVYYIGKKEHSENVIIGIIYFLLLFTSVTGMGICFGILTLLHNPDFTLPLKLTAILIIPVKLCISYSSAYFLGREQIGRFNRVQWISQLFYLAMICLLLWYLKTGVIGGLIAVIVSTGFTAAYAVSMVVKSVKNIRLRFDWAIIKKMLSLGIIYALSLFVMQMNYRIDIMIMERLTDKVQIGLYNTGVSMVELLWFLPTALGTVIFSKSVNAKDDHAFSIKIGKLLRVSFIAVFLAGTALFIVAPFIVPLMFGKAFDTSALVVQTLMPGVVFFTIYKVLGMDIAGKGKPWVSILVMIPAVILNVVLNIYLVPKYGAIGASYSSTISYSLASIIYLPAYAKVVGVPVKTLITYKTSDFEFLKKFKIFARFGGMLNKSS
ncbi:polysaccharide biosynthesis C-terminal domain-containing protein [uncultured Desulfobulbus sp.]|uniref:oligosaccharide flippase family protein n=1 Tax=uncultured Desulfobulbus sp. TaxID=239745 RepID=UPI0029C603F5|nr:polysaccharide biosynthesis C-terminal domain-containing protein [uncultured Desulfobulbus sp.]